MEYRKHNLKQIIDVKKIISIHYFELSKNFDYPAEAHDFWEFHYVDKGQVISLADGKENCLHQSEIIFHKPLSTHQLKSDGAIAPNVCVLSFECKSKAMEFFKDKIFKLNKEQRTLIQNLFNEVHSVFDIPFSDPQINQLKFKPSIPLCGLQLIKIRLEEFLISLMSKFQPKENDNKIFTIQEEYNDEVVNKIIKYLHENINKNITLENICKEFNFSKTYICVRFSAVTNKTINKYFMELKINAAKKLIREKDKTRELFSQISDFLGFSSPAYFYYTFKKYTNMSPSEYSKSVHKYG